MSVEAVHVKPICVLEEAVATRFEGAEGGVVSATARVVADAVFESAESPPVLCARMR